MPHHQREEPCRFLIIRQRSCEKMDKKIFKKIDLS